MKLKIVTGNGSFIVTMLFTILNTKKGIIVVSRFKKINDKVR